MGVNLLKRMKRGHWLTGLKKDKLIGDLRQANGVDDETVDANERQMPFQKYAQSLVCAWREPRTSDAPRTPKKAVKTRKKNNF